jgi:hypothetical protein
VPGASSAFHFDVSVFVEVSAKSDRNNRNDDLLQRHNDADKSYLWSLKYGVHTESERDELVTLFGSTTAT